MIANRKPSDAEGEDNAYIGQHTVSHVWLFALE